ncbi:MAG: hypothetical protein AB7K71_18475, partial [Polyangiaceae bacterium]
SSVRFLGQEYGEETERVSADGVVMARDLEALIGLRKLTNLFLSGATLDDAALKPLHRLRSLVDLDISDPRITDAGMPDLARCSGLRHLRIKENDLSERKRVTPSARARER